MAEIADRFQGRKAVVTGGASGIGWAIVERLASEGASVSIWDRAGAPAERRAGGRAIEGIQLDLTDAAAVEAAAKRTIETLGGIDILVCSAGVAGLNALVWEYPLDEWRKVIDINLNALFYCNRAVVPHMREKNYGRIVNIASIAGKEGNPTASAYSASKAAVIGLTKSLGKELAKTNITVNAVTPGGGQDADLRPGQPGAHRFHALQDPDGPLRKGGGDRRARVLAGERGMLVHHRRGVRHFRGPRDLLKRRALERLLRRRVEDRRPVSG